MALIALEEHYAWDPASVGNVVGACTARSHPVRASRISSTLPIPPSNGFRRLRTCVPPGVTATSSGELEPICSLRAKRTRSNGTTAPPETKWVRPPPAAFVQRLAAPAAKLAHHGVGHCREGEADGQEHRAQSR